MTVIRCMGLASNEPCGVIGQWLESYDPEAFAGRGEAVWTADLGRAMRFESLTAAFYFVRQIPKLRPRRADGKANRPLTTFHLSFENDSGGNLSDDFTEVPTQP